MDDPRVWLVSGATGLVGGRLLRGLLADALVVRALTRNLKAASTQLDPRVLLVRWDGTHFPVDGVNGAEAVVHLSGEPIFRGLQSRLGAARRRLIYESRVHSTRSLVKSIGALRDGDRPKVLICASAVGIYGSRGEEVLGEDAGPGEGFLADVCRDWEAAALEAEALGVRTVCLRIGIVLAAGGGALPMMATPFRLGLGGRLGRGDQWFPWIQLDDLARLVRSVARDERYRGPVNAVAPEPVRNRELTRALARQLSRPAFLPVPGFAVRAALGELAEELLGSRRVVPGRAREHGFRWEHASLESALAAELSG